MYEELVRLLKEKAGRFNYDGWVDTAVVMEKAADAIEELSKWADAIPHVCECCVGCELEKTNGGCDHAFVLSPKRAMQYLINPRWIPVTERFPKDCTPVQVCYIGYHSKEIGSDMLACRYEGLWCYWDGEPCSYDPCRVEITHWMPLKKPPKEKT